jgi:hypothetical protein
VFRIDYRCVREFEGGSDRFDIEIGVRNFVKRTYYKKVINTLCLQIVIRNLTQWGSRVDDATFGIVRIVVRGSVIFVIALWSWLSVRDLIMIQGVRLAVDFYIDCAVVHEELVLLHESRESLCDDAGVLGVFNVYTDHLRKKLRDIILARLVSFPKLSNPYRRLATIHVILPRAVGHEPNLINDVQEVLNDVQSNFRERALGTQKTLDYPERVPVVWLPETTAGNNECAVHGNERAHAASAVPGANILAGQIGPDIDDLADEIANVGAVDVLQERGIRCQIS